MTELMAKVIYFSVLAIGAGELLFSATWVWWRVLDRLMVLFKFKKEFLLWLIEKKRRGAK